MINYWFNDCIKFRVFVWQPKFFGRMMSVVQGQISPDRHETFSIIFVSSNSAVCIITTLYPDDTYEKDIKFAGFVSFLLR